ncbi:MAG TPA: hypothetical protein VF739_13475 [Ktedonobacterales bacterium]|jgi:hypothetical protein
MRRKQDNRMPPRRWWFLALMVLLAFGAFCLVTRSWTPLADGWPIIALVFALAIIRQGADLYERRQPHAHLERRHPPHV